MARCLLLILSCVVVGCAQGKGGATSTAWDAPADTVIADFEPDATAADGAVEGSEDPVDAAADPPDVAVAVPVDAIVDAIFDAPPPSPQVLIISIDGLRPDAIFRAPALNLQRLAARGSFSWTARTISNSLTLPSHSSMLSGFPAEVHGISWNDLRPGYIGVPTVFSVAHHAGLRTVMVVGKDKMQQLAAPGVIDAYVLALGGDDDVAKNAIVEVGRGFDVMFVHFPSVDLTGHATHWMSPEYLSQVFATDAALGRLLAVVPPTATVIVSADHGGSGNIHWSGVAEDFTIPWVIAGPRTHSGREISTSIATVDTAATTAYVLGLSLRADTTGRPVKEAFDN